MLTKGIKVVKLRAVNPTAVYFYPLSLVSLHYHLAGGKILKVKEADSGEKRSYPEYSLTLEVAPSTASRWGYFFVGKLNLACALLRPQNYFIQSMWRG